MATSMTLNSSLGAETSKARAVLCRVQYSPY